MSATKQTSGNDKAGSEHPPKLVVEDADYQDQQQNRLTKLIRQGKLSPSALAPRNILQLQSVIGNRAVARHLAGKMQEAEARNGEVPSVLRKTTPSKSRSMGKCKVEIEGKVVADFHLHLDSGGSSPGYMVRLLEGVVHSVDTVTWLHSAHSEGRRFVAALLVSDPRRRENLRITLKNAIVDRLEIGREQVKGSQVPFKELVLVSEDVDFGYGKSGNAS